MLLSFYEVAADLTDIPSANSPPWSILHDSAGITRLCHEDRGVVMSNEPFEVEEAAEFVAGCFGSVLVLGLGLGMVVRMLLANPKVTRIDIVESEASVIGLVAGSLIGATINIHQANAYSEHTPNQLFRGMRSPFDHAWLDIFDTIDARSYIQRVRAAELWNPHTFRLGVWGFDRSRKRYLAT
jgi:hypothetical protein